MGIFIERQGFTKVHELATALVTDLIANGFTLQYPSSLVADSKQVILEPSANVNSLHDTQQWAIKFQWDQGVSGVLAPETAKGGVLDVIVATPLQFNYETGAHATYTKFTGSSSGSDGSVAYDVNGLIGTASGRVDAQGSTSLSQGFADRTFIDRQRLTISQTGDATLSYPMSYAVTISDRGLAIFVWEHGTDQYSNRFSWLIVQRPVNHTTGQQIVSGKAPVHCVYGLMKPQTNQPWAAGDSLNLRRFIVREADVQVPYPQAPVVTTAPNRNDVTLQGVDATQSTRDYAPIINAHQQVAITEDNKYVVVLPNGLNTSRYAYTHELDMIAYTSADVVSMGADVPVQVYGEGAPRIYRAMHANGPDNTGMRILMLRSGGGVEPEDAP